MIFAVLARALISVDELKDQTEIFDAVNRTISFLQLTVEKMVTNYPQDKRSEMLGQIYVETDDHKFNAKNQVEEKRYKLVKTMLMTADVLWHIKMETEK